MKILYLDTNIIVFYIKKEGKFKNSSMKLMNTNIFERVGSAITILKSIIL